MISDLGGNEGRLSPYRLNRFIAEGGARSPPPPLGAAAFACLQSPGLGKDVGTPTESVSGVFLKCGGNFHRAELG